MTRKKDERMRRRDARKEGEEKRTKVEGSKVEDRGKGTLGNKKMGGL